MKGQLLVLLVTAVVVASWRIRRAPQSPGDDDDDLNLDPLNETPCLTKTNQTGICVHESYCTEDHTFQPGGVIHDTDLRAGNCPGKFDWCCTREMTTKRPKTSKPKEAEQSCVLDNRTKGTCVLEALCRTNGSLEAGGVITDKEIRSQGCPPTRKCCNPEELTTSVTVNPLDTTPAVTGGTATGRTPDPSSTDNPTSEVTGDPKCPNCAAIYRIGGHPLTMSPSGLFCGGVMVNPRVVLTSAGCISAGKKKVVWVQVAGSSQPLKKFNVTATARRTGYNPGTKEYDIGLMQLDDDVTFGSEVGGLQIGPRYTLKSTCTATGYNDDDDSLTMSQVKIDAGSCTDRGNGIDAACGRTEDSCLASPGSPVICPTNTPGETAVAGVAKDKCNAGALMLTNLEQSVDWVLSHEWVKTS